MDSEDKGETEPPQEQWLSDVKSPGTARPNLHLGTEFLNCSRHSQLSAPGRSRKDGSRRSLNVWLGSQIWQIAMLCAGKDVKVFLEKEVPVSHGEQIKVNPSPEAVTDQETGEQSSCQAGRKSFLFWSPYD